MMETKKWMMENKKWMMGKPWKAMTAIFSSISRQSFDGKNIGFHDKDGERTFSLTTLEYFDSCQYMLNKFGIIYFYFILPLVIFDRLDTRQTQVQFFQYHKLNQLKYETSKENYLHDRQQTCQYKISQFCLFCWIYTTQITKALPYT